MKAALPFNEEARLAALYDFAVLDTLPEPLFEDLTLLASHICNTPISLISLIDHDRQWFKSKRGLEIQQTSRDFAFCAHALHQPDELLMVGDATEDPRFADNPLVQGEPHIRFYTGAPLVTASGEALGTICVIDQQPRELTPEQQSALQALARQTMSQLEARRQTLRLADQMALRVQIEATLRESESRFVAFMDYSPLVAFIKNGQGHYTYVNQPFLDRFELQREQVIGHTDLDLWPHAAERIAQLDAQTFSVDSKEISVSLETGQRPDGAIQYWQVYRFALRQGGGQKRLLGGVALDVTANKTYEKQLEEYQCKLEATLQQVQAQSLQDGLTGLYNRRAFDEKITSEIERVKRYHQPLSVLMLDVDHFKSYNDSFGHQEGDQVLQTVAHLFKGQARANDFVARYGGEEFVILLPNTTRSGALVLAERFRQAIEDKAWPKRKVSISIGTATLATDLATARKIDPGTEIDVAKALINAADTALYAAKQNGRNRVMQSPE